MVWQGLKWMLSSRSPFYVKPRLDPGLIRWGWLFARHCTPAHTRRAAPLLRDLCLAGRELFVDLANKTGNAFELRTEGLLNLCKTPEGLEHEARALGRVANEVGVEARVLDARETAAMEPGARLDVAGSIYFPIDAHLIPGKFIATLIALLHKRGVKFHWKTRVDGWRVEAGRVTAAFTSAGDLVADEYILATGSWAAEMLRGSGIRLPMQPGKGYSLTITQPRFKFSKPMILSERRVAVTPMGDQLRFGGTMELSGHSGSVLPERVEQIIAAAQSYLPGFSCRRFCRDQAMVRLSAHVAGWPAVHWAVRSLLKSYRGLWSRHARCHARPDYRPARRGNAYWPQAECGDATAKSRSFRLRRGLCPGRTRSVCHGWAALQEIELRLPRKPRPP